MGERGNFKTLSQAEESVHSESRERERAVQLGEIEKTKWGFEGLGSFGKEDGKGMGAARVEGWGWWVLPSKRGREKRADEEKKEHIWKDGFEMGIEEIKGKCLIRISIPAVFFFLKF